MDFAKKKQTSSRKRASKQKRSEGKQNKSSIFSSRSKYSGLSSLKKPHIFQKNSATSNKNKSKEGRKPSLLKQNDVKNQSVEKKKIERDEKADDQKAKKTGLLNKGLELRKPQENKQQESEKKGKKKILNSSFLLKKKSVTKSTVHEKEISFTLSEDQLNSLKKMSYKQQGIQHIGDWEEIDQYPLVESYVYASILQHKDTNERRYFLVEIQLSKEEQEQYAFIKDAFEVISLDTVKLIEKGELTVLKQQLDEIIEDYSLTVPLNSKAKILYYLRKNFLELGLIEPLMKDPHIEDVSCDGAGVPIFVYHRLFGSVQSNVMFADEEILASFVTRLAQKCSKHISISHPMLDATMPDGSRIQMTLSTEVSTKGSTFTIRKFKEQPFSPADLIHFNTMSSEMMAYLWLAVQYGNSALVSGGTASGKTSLLNAISLFIPRESKIVSIEETREINLPHPNWIPGVARSGFGDVVGGKMTGEIDLFDLMKAALRQRPEYIIVGEIRGREAYVLFQAMATGHTTYSTVHADSTKSLIHRLEGEPINIPRVMLQSLDIVCIQSIARVKNKRVRRCKQIVEIIDIDPTTKEILTNEVFRWDPIKDTYAFTGKSFILEQIRVNANLTRDEIQEELKRRSMVLSWMVKNEMYVFDDVATLTANYLENPDEVLENIEVRG